MRYILALFYTFIPFLAAAQDSAPVSSASPASAGEAPGGIQGLIIQLGIIFVIFYFLLIRPQQKKFKDHKLLVAALKKGDKVITGAGFLGTVTKATEGENTVNVEIAKGVEVTLLRSSITELTADKKADKKEPKKLEKK